jgi:predicted PurR-regulated permease PerM
VDRKCNNGISGPCIEEDKTRLEDELIHEVRWVRRLLAVFLLILITCIGVIGASVFVPVVLATLLSLILAPTVRALCRLHVPRSLAAAAVVTAVVAFIVTVLAGLSGPARDWIARVPKTLDRVAQTAHDLLRRPLQAAAQAGQAWSDLTQAPSGAQPVRVVDAGTPDALWQILSATPGVVVSTLVTLLLVYVFLRYADTMLLKSVQLAPQWRLKREIVDATRSAQYELSRYMLTIGAINLVLGMVVTIAMWSLGVPNPLLWGGVAALFNFAPYVGPLLTLIVLSVVGFSETPSLLLALSVPGSFLLLHIVESWIFTPLLVGRRLALDPVITFIALLILGAMWGVAGLLIAMPALTCVKIIAERVPQLRALAQVLSCDQGTLVYSQSPSVASEISE